MNTDRNSPSDPPAAAPPSFDPTLWAIVLAAGEGTRLAPVTRLLYGHDLPKQFAALNSDRTLLQETMARLGMIVPPERTVVVVAHERRELAETQLVDYAGVQIVSQPANRGTGPGVLLPLSLIKAQCPAAMVIVTPSDHNIPRTGAFVAATEMAVAAAHLAPAGMAVLGAEADGPATDLGWIVPKDHGGAPDADVDLVDVFVEKPPIEIARQLFRRGGLWNTLIVLGSVSSFWKQARWYLSRHTSLFTEYLDALAQNGGRPHATANALLAQLYRTMPSADFSVSVLQNARGMAVVKLKDSGWCDCGTPERLLSCLPGGPRRQLLEAIRHAGRETQPQLRPVPA
jgi:mannose-1-phosphate guanylyltransferase